MIADLIDDKESLAQAKLLKEKPGRGIQLPSGFKQELAAEALFTSLVSLYFPGIDAQPGSQLLLRQPAKAASYRNAFADLCSQIRVEGW